MRSSDLNARQTFFTIQKAFPLLRAQCLDHYERLRGQSLWGHSGMAVYSDKWHVLAFVRT